MTSNRPSTGGTEPSAHQNLGYGARGTGTVIELGMGPKGASKLGHFTRIVRNLLNGTWVDWVVPIGFGALLCLVAPLGTAFQFGPDEGYEFMKAFLVSVGHPLYSEIWNDQPPLHTEILALLFRLFGPSALVG